MAVGFLATTMVGVSPLWFRSTPFGVRYRAIVKCRAPLLGNSTVSCTTALPKVRWPTRIARPSSRSAPETISLALAL